MPAQEQARPRQQYLERAVSLASRLSRRAQQSGRLFVREQNYPAAEERFKTCIRVAPNFDQAYLNLARLYVILNDKEKARDVLRALLRQQPQHKVAQQALEMLN